jgi:hypothetical protein
MNAGGGGLKPALRWRAGKTGGMNPRGSLRGDRLALRAKTSEGRRAGLQRYDSSDACLARRHPPELSPKAARACAIVGDWR